MPSNSILAQTYDLALDIAEEQRASLMMALRFMDVALWRMPFARRFMRADMGTDGYRLYLDPVATVARYRTSSGEVLRDYLHAILHCVFRHPFDDKHADAALWDLACDIAVEACAIDLVGLRYPSALDASRKDAFGRLQAFCPRLTATKLYRALSEQREAETESGRARARAFEDELRMLFFRDDHGVWTRSPEQRGSRMKLDEKSLLLDEEASQRLSSSGEGDEDDDDTLNPGETNQDGTPAKSTGGLAVEAEVDGGDRLMTADSGTEAESEFASMDLLEEGEDFEALTWKDISRILEIEMEAFTGKFGLDAGNFEVNLSVANRKTYDYRDFLKRFSSRSEEMKVSTDEFDYIYYTYGLRKYGNMPLVEPLEYQESDRVRDFVIAIDTSASCAGGYIQKFVEKTYDVLKSTNGFGRKMNVHVVQCDSDIRSDTVIKQAADIDQGFSTFSARGHGGTDFRPVFRYVNELVEARELTNLKGLIYLTDGIGKYPIEPPDYDTVFVFIDEEQAARPVPAWAMKVYMSEDDIVEL